MVIETYEPESPLSGEYSLSIGSIKGLKNTAVILIPFLLTWYASNSASIPEKYALPIGTIIAFLAYLYKNYLENS